MINPEAIKVVEQMIAYSENPENQLEFADWFEELISHIVVDEITNPELQGILFLTSAVSITGLAIRMFQLGRESVNQDWKIFE